MKRSADTNETRKNTLRRLYREATLPAKQKP